MKKLLLMLVACFAAIAANAGTIYLVGSGTVDGKSLGGSPNGNCVSVTSDNNVYTFKVNNIGWMKFSDTNASDWATFNKNGWTIDGKGDYALSASDLGKTFNLWYSNGSSEGTNNINPPSSGEYTYTLTVGAKGSNQSTLVVTAASDEKITYEIYLRGSWDGYGTSANYKFAQVGDTDDYELTGVTLSSGTTFKIADANWGAMNFGGAGKVNANTSYTLTYNGSDMTLNQDITNATIKFNIDTHVMYIEDATADPDVPVTPDYSNVWLHIGGAFNGYDFYNGGINPNDEGIATFSNLAIGTSGFKVHIWTGEEGDVYYIMDDPNGGTEVPTGEWVQYVKDGYDIYDTVEGATADAVYNVEYNVNTNQLYITLVSGGTVTPTPSFPETVYLLGNVNGTDWSTTAGVAATGNEGVYNWTGVTIDDADNGSGYFNIATVLGADWDNGPNKGNRYGAPASNTPITAGTPANVTLYAEGVNASSCQSWKADAGTYDITLDLNTMKVTLTAVEDDEPVTPPTPDLGDNYTATYTFTSFDNIKVHYAALPALNTWTSGTNALTTTIPNGAKLLVDGATIDVDYTTGTAPVFYDVESTSKFDLRYYTGTTLTVAVPEGYTIDKITFTTEGVKTTINKMTLVEGQPGTFVNPDEANKTMVWTAPATARTASVINSLQFSTTSTTATRIASIEIETSKVATEEPGESTTLYVVGDGDGIGWDLPGTEFTGEDGVVTMNLTNVTKFKVATVKATDWDAEGTGYNANTIAPADGATFGDDVANEGGQTLSIATSVNDIVLPWTGDYTITINLNNSTMTAYTATPKPEAGSLELYLMGAVNDWSDNSDYLFKYDESIAAYVLTLASLDGGSEFKISTSDWATQFNNGNKSLENGTYDVVRGGDNMALGQNMSNVTLTLDVENLKLTIAGTPEGANYSEYWFNFICSNNDWATIPGAQLMEGNETTATLANYVHMTPETEFIVKIWNGADDVYYTYPEVVPVGKWVELNVREGETGGNMKANVTEDTRYNIFWNFATHSILFEFTTGVESIDAENREAVYYNLQGVKVANPENGLFIKVVDGKATKVLVRK